MEPWPIKPNTGGPLDPNDIVGRDAVCRAILDDLRENDQRLVDPRRMGKTELIRRLQTVADDRVTVVFIDFQGTESADEFYGRLVSGLGRHSAFWTAVHTSGP
jgi:hypothetical protein